MTLRMNPRGGDTIHPCQVFDRACYESRLDELTHAIIEQLKWIDIDARVLEDRKAFRTPSVYPLTEDEVYAKFHVEARAEAEKVIEVERKSVVEYQANHMKICLKNAIKTLQFLVYTPRGTKGKVYRERKIVLNPRTHHFEERDVSYFESYPEGEERLLQISNAGLHCDGFDRYVPYMSEELKALWLKFSDLSHLESGVVVKDDKAKSESEETAKTDSSRT